MVNKAIGDCVVCAQARARRGPHPHSCCPLPFPSFPFSSIAIDFVEPEIYEPGHGTKTNTSAVNPRTGAMASATAKTTKAPWNLFTNLAMVIALEGPWSHSRFFFYLDPHGAPPVRTWPFLGRHGLVENPRFPGDLRQPRGALWLLLGDHLLTMGVHTNPWGAM